MITTVTLNAAIDKTYYTGRFELGTVTRVGEMISMPGGKGINVARVVRLLGGSVIASGFVGGFNGEYMVSELGKQGINADFVRVEGESRLCLNIIDTYNRVSTELLEQGPAISPEQALEMKDKIADLAAKSSIVVLSGSLPKGVSVSFYAELTAELNRLGVKVFVDTSGDALLEAVKAKPFFIKPNEHEVEKLLGKRIEHESELHACIRELLASGISCVAVSLGEAGSIAGYGGELFRIRAPRIEAVNTVGCGDSFVAGMALALSNNEPIEECLRLATASGTANALMPGAGVVDPDTVHSLLEHVQISKID